MRIENQVALVTGAGRGLGRALAETLARAGAKVVLVARRGGDVEEIARALRAEGKIAHAIAADIGDKGAVHPLAAQIAELLGPVDLLINNASTLGPTPLRLLLDTDCEDLEAALAVNVVGAFRLTKAIAGSMALRGTGLIVNVSSDAATTAYSSWGAYGASKAATDHLTRIWATELQGTGVRFFSVDPGEMDTDMHAAAIPDADRSSLARPTDVARTIVSMIGDRSIASGARLEVSSFKRAS
jgi:NAD(P)-dependent dehydrogenase (short-subunit alcohol dehydrogenase family)